MQVIDGRAIALNYLRAWCAIDVVASFPLDWCLSNISGEGDPTILIRLFRLGKLAKMLRLLRLLRLRRITILSQYEASDQHAAYLMWIRSAAWSRQLLTFIWLTHMNGCLQYACDP